MNKLNQIGLLLLTLAIMAGGWFFLYKVIVGPIEYQSPTDAVAIPIGSTENSSVKLQCKMSATRAIYDLRCRFLPQAGLEPLLLPRTRRRRVLSGE